MIGKLDKEIVAKFKEFQEKTGKHSELYIEDVEFENISLSNEKYFTFIKGKNKYIQRYIKVNKGDYPILGSSLKNNCISAYIKPIEESDIVNEKSVTFNKDNTKGSVPFFRDYPYLMDRHHIAIIPNDEVVDAKYLEKSLIRFFENSKFGWGDNVADVSAVQKHLVPIPKDLNKFYSSYQIQEAIVEFLEACKIGYTDIHRERVNRKQPILKTIKKILVPNTFKYDKKLVESFNLFSKKKGYDLNFEDIEFEKNDIFNDEKNIQLIGSKKLGTHDELKKIHDDKGFPVYDASANILTYIKESRFTNEIFEVIDKFNPDISFASEGNSSAGTNFIIHDGKYYVNNHRTVIKFSKKYYSKYIYYNIFRMKEKYGFKRGYIPSQQELKKLKIMVSIPKGLPHRYDSLGIQNILVEFWEIIILDIDNQLKIYDRTLELADKIDEAFLYRTFSKIDWSKK